MSTQVRGAAFLRIRALSDPVADSSPDARFPTNSSDNRSVNRPPSCTLSLETISKRPSFRLLLSSVYDLQPVSPCSIRAAAQPACV